MCTSLMVTVVSPCDNRPVTEGRGYTGTVPPTWPSRWSYLWGRTPGWRRPGKSPKAKILKKTITRKEANVWGAETLWLPKKIWFPTAMWHVTLRKKIPLMGGAGGWVPEVETCTNGPGSVKLPVETCLKFRVFFNSARTIHGIKEGFDTFFFSF